MDDTGTTDITDDALRAELIDRIDRSVRGMNARVF